ncbi:integrase [Variovorax paradoxus]|nr:integrase [Variovorax paradoxus]
MSIGAPADWPLERARSRAQTLKMLVDTGVDPREVERQQQADKVQAARDAAARSLTVSDLWPTYLTEGRPKRRAAWKPRYLSDLKKMASAGGEKKKRGLGLTRSGPLYPLQALALHEVNEDRLKAWYDAEARSGEHQAARALMMFRGFLRWCAAQPKYRGLIDRAAGSAPAIAENLPATKRRTDALEAAQLPGWFEGIQILPNQTAACYLQCLLLTGARREELAALRWAHVDFRWKRLTLADKVDATRTIPLSAYVSNLFKSLPRVNDFVFASQVEGDHIKDTRASHAKALQHAGIERLTLHGLRRSFSLLGEAAGAPAGAIAQVMGHKPSATAEGYRPRSVDALRPFVALIEAHILATAGIAFDPAQEQPALRVVAS